ncbi:hypothetical protein KBD33_00780 [Candidatus Gracilibacteria bacterium]|nr:hypothetical protein [Candidatus Gracilibacteria bacterium]
MSELQRNEPSLADAKDLFGKAFDAVGKALSSSADTLSRNFENAVLNKTLEASKAVGGAIDSTGKAIKDTHESAVSGTVRGMEGVAKVGQVLSDRAKVNIDQMAQAASRGKQAVVDTHAAVVAGAVSGAETVAAARQKAIDATSENFTQVGRVATRVGKLGEKVVAPVIAAWESTDPDNSAREQVSASKPGVDQKKGENILSEIKNLSDKSMNALSKREFAKILEGSNPAQVDAILGSTNEKGVLNILKPQTILKESSPSILIDGKLGKETIAAIKSLKVTPPAAV